MYMTDRKSSYKLPPTTIRTSLSHKKPDDPKHWKSKNAAQKVDSSRQLDLFADLSLAEPSDEDVQVGEEAINDDDDNGGTSTQPGLSSVAAYVSLLQTTDLEEMKETAPQRNVLASSMPSQYPCHQLEASTSYAPSSFKELHATPIDKLDDPSGAAQADTKKPRKRGGKNSHKRRSEAHKASNSNKYKGGSSKWADKCMYAELLEMNSDDVWSGTGGVGYDEHEHNEQDIHDGLPRDLESGWVAVAPVPKGKRCLVVTQQSAGVAGVVPNTTLRSRLLGKSLLARFPSSLPPLTVLDCILDDNWRENGILHVLDVVRWKGQDVAECEAGFRFWWRDTRLAELPQTPPPSFHFISSHTAPLSPSKNISEPQSNRYHFPYPITFIPVPYHSNTTLPALDAHIVPAARSARVVSITLPSSIPASLALPQNTSTTDGTSPLSTLDGDREMEVEPSPPSPLAALQLPMDVNDKTFVPTTVLVQPDGLLLYVAEASYEPGTSPLSSWIPIRGYTDDADANLGERVVHDGPLNLFQRLVRKRLNRKLLLGSEFSSNGGLVVAGGKSPSAGDIEMEF